VASYSLARGQGQNYLFMSIQSPVEGGHTCVATASSSPGTRAPALPAMVGPVMGREGQGQLEPHFSHSYPPPFLSSSSPSAPPVSPSQTLAASASSSPLTCMLGFDAENKSFLLTLSP
jgi:hypothetical protein